MIMKKINILLLLLTPFLAYSQEGNKTKITKDIEIAENILSSLLEQGMDDESGVAKLAYGIDGDVEGTYIADFGAMFTIGGSSRGGHSIISIGEGSNISNSFHYNLRGTARARANKKLPYILKLYTDDDKKEERGELGDVEVIETTFEPFEFFKEVTMEFFVDYGYLLKGVKPQEKVLIRYGLGNSRAFAITGWAQVDGWEELDNKDFHEGGKYTATVLKADIDALQKGSITRSQFEAKVEYSEGKAEVQEGNKDTKLLNSIFSRLYKEDLSGNACISSRSTPRSEYIPGLGMVVNMRMSARCNNWRGGFDRLEFFREGGGQNGIALLDSDRKDREEGKDKEEEKESPDDHYGSFLIDLQENIVEYGSIAKSLEKDEVLIFKLDFQGCRDCEIVPDRLNISVKQSTLVAYRQGKTSLDQAVKQLTITE